MATIGFYPGCKVPNDIKFLDPHESFSFQESPKSNILGFTDAPDIEYKFYRMKAREYILPTDEDSLEQLKIRVQMVKDFWKNQNTSFKIVSVSL